MILINRKYLHVAWSKIPPTGRLKKYKRRPRVKSIYVQILWLEVVVWYG